MPTSGSPTSTRLEPGSPPPQRRHRGLVVALVSAAVVLAVTVPIALRGGDVFGGDDAAVAPDSTTPTPTAPTPTAHDEQQPARGVLDVSDLPSGAAPGMAYVEKGVLHQPDGSTVDVDTRYPVTAFAVLADGSRVWQTSKGGTTYVEIQRADGTLGDPVRSEFGLGVNPAHTIAAWVTPAGQAMVWGGGSADPAPLGDPITAGHDLRVGAVTGDDCSLACSVVVNAFSARSASGWQPWEASLNGTEPLRDGGYLLVNDISEAGLTVGYTRITDLGSCSKLLGGGEFQGFSTCRHTLDSFSPDGKLLLADPAYHDGIGNGVIAMYDLEGTRLFDRHSTANAQSFYPRAEWETTTQVLAPVFQDGRWSVVRFTSDGTMEYAVAPVPGRDVENPFVLPTGGAVVGD
jgi:hypothetical protein